MIRYFSISTFRKHLKGLLDVKRNVYAGVEDELRREFADTSIEGIRQNRDMILADAESSVIKLRLPDKRQRLSKSNGYRLIYLVSKVNPVVVFMDIYPKNGPRQKINLQTGELENLLKEFISESAQSALLPYEL